MMEAKAAIKQALDDKTIEIIRYVNKLAQKNDSGEKDAKEAEWQDVNKEYRKVMKVIKDKKDVGGSSDGKRQFTNLVEASAQASCIDEFKLYIEYKGSKSGTENLWKDFAKPFNGVIDRLMKDIACKIIEEFTEQKIKIDEEEVRLEVLRRFCGYLMWRSSADSSADPNEGGANR